MVQATDDHMLSDNSAHYTINHLKPECAECFGLCCVALYFSTQDGFPTDKIAGKPCPNLEENFHCMIHEKLKACGLKGCAAYECFGAGQQVSQVTFKGRNWREEPSSADVMFDVFLIMQQLHEMCWYLTEALSFQLASPIREEIGETLHETERITRFAPPELKAFNLSEHHTKVSALLKKASSLMRNQISLSNKIRIDLKKETPLRGDFFGKDLRKKNLRCANLRGACLIAANLEGADLCGADFIGADFRDARLNGADLSKSIFLTQSQINVAKGNASTKLPLLLSRPKHWDK